MPSREEHVRHCRELYGYGFEEIHAWMDGTVKSRGRGHRVDRHDMNITPDKAYKIFKDKVPEKYREFIKDVVKDHIEMDKREGHVSIVKPDKILHIGNKSSMSYVLVITTLIKEGADGIVLKARGRAISRAVDVAEIVRNKFPQDLEILNIETGTEEIEREDGGTSNISNISISLGVKEEASLKKTKKKSGCLIATAAYGTPLAKDLDALRDFRDEKLLTNNLGKSLTTIYYKTSPPIAKIISKSNNLRKTIRSLLFPVVEFLKN